MKVVTFSCQNKIFVYPEKCSALPRPPYKSHRAVSLAKKYMKEERGIENAKTVILK